MVPAAPLSHLILIRRCKNMRHAPQFRCTCGWKRLRDCWLGGREEDLKIEVGPQNRGGLVVGGGALEYNAR